MSDGSAADKRDKKRTKAALKAAKKEAKAEGQRGALGPAASVTPRNGNSAAERGARAAEEKVRLERWRVVLGAVGAAVAVITLVVMLQRGCGGG